MAEKLKQLFEKVDQLIGRLDDFKSENDSLKVENKRLQGELVELRKAYKLVRVAQNDRADTIKSKLTGILDRLSQLEEMAG